MKQFQNFILQLFIEIDHDISTKYELELIKWSVRDKIMLKKYYSLSDFSMNQYMII